VLVVLLSSRREKKETRRVRRVLCSPEGELVVSSQMRLQVPGLIFDQGSWLASAKDIDVRSGEPL
jgi:hypothetical protein